MTVVVFDLKDDKMIKDELNKLVMASNSVKITTEVRTKTKRRRSRNGEPKPYWDGSRAKHVGYFIDGTSKKHKKVGTGATFEQATKDRDQKLEALKRSLSVEQLPTEIVTLERYCRYWLDEVIRGKTQLAPKTYRNYLNAINKWIGPNIGEIEVVNITSKDLRRLFNNMADAGLGRSSQNQVRAVLRPVVTLAMQELDLKQDPMLGVKLIKQQKKLPDFYSREDRQKLLLKARELGTELKWTLALVLGLRQGERLGLTWDRVRLEGEEPYLFLDRQLQRIPGKGLRLVNLKTAASNRIIPLNPSQVQLFEAQRPVNEVIDIVHGTDSGARSFVFRSGSGQPIDARSDAREWKKLCELAGVRYLSVHKARHTALTLLDTSLHTKKHLAGHSSIQVTSDMYGGFDVKVLRQALADPN